MKKFIALLLAMTLVLCGFAACTGDGENKETEAETKAETEAETKAEEKVEIETIKEGTLTMATNAYFPPYEYIEGEEYMGIDIEIAEAIAEKLGLELEILNMEFNTLLVAVNENKADLVLAGLTVDDERKKEVDFSISYASGVQSIIVKQDSPITTADDLFAEDATYTAGVQLGTTGDSYASGDLGEDRVYRVSNGNEAVQALLKGDIDCVVIDNEPAKAYVAENEGLKILDTSYIEEDYAACFAKGNDALREAVDDAIMELTADGTIDAIIDKYIKK